MKLTQRLDYNRLAEVLAERNMVEPAAIHELLQASNDGGQAFPEALIASNLVSDWDLSKVVCEIFQLPFLPLEFIQPSTDLIEMFDAHFLHDSGLVPLARFGNVLTLAMPALVPADILAMLAAETDMVLLPVVGTVTANRKWLKENVIIKKVSEDASWGSLFDEGDAAVQEALTVPLEGAEHADLDLGDLGEDTASLEFTDHEEDDHGTSLESVPSLAEMDDELSANLEFPDLEEDEDSPTSSGAELPPMPDFG